jgi:hypothetical protein
MMPTATDMRHARQLWDYLRLGVPVRPAGCLLVFGGHDLGVAGRAAELYADGIAPFIVVSGGSRAVPDGSDFATEADAIADVLLRRDIPKDAIARERLASNTSENFWLSAELLRDLGMDPQTFLVVHKPYAERRTMATARRRWPGRQVAVTSEQIGFDDYCAGDIPRAGSCPCWPARRSAWSLTPQPASSTSTSPSPKTCSTRPAHCKLRGTTAAQSANSLRPP